MEEQKKVQEAFETIRKAFEDKLGQKVHAIHGIDLIVGNDNEETDSKEGFKLFDGQKDFHSVRPQSCRMIHGVWVCPR